MSSDEWLERLALRLRPHQKAILEYERGRMGIIAVPGSGKTLTLSLLAAGIIMSTPLEDNQEVLVVTLVNSAVDLFYQRVSAFVTAAGLLPNTGYVVRTLHGLAHDILRERPGLVGLPEDFQIVDERISDTIRNDVAVEWLHRNPDALEIYLDSGIEEEKLDWVRREHLPGLVRDLAQSFIRTAKDLQLTPEGVDQHLDRLPVPLPLAEIGADLYREYQRALLYRSAVDFDDLIRLALLALESDPAYLSRLRFRWPFLLEDEAQDSSRLQEQILRLLCGEDGNWIRVGDPNQAIYETFTTASPAYLRAFTQEAGVRSLALPESGRSTPSIIYLANQLVRWVQEAHPDPDVRSALAGPPFIEPTEADDPNPNPPDQPGEVHLVGRKFTPGSELLAVVNSLAKWLPEHPDKTVAVLTPRNERAELVVAELRRRGIPVVEDLLRSTQSTRQTAGKLGAILEYLANPLSGARLAAAFSAWQATFQPEEHDPAVSAKAAQQLRHLQDIEQYVWPAAGADWLESSGLAGSQPEVWSQLAEFRRELQSWQRAILLPIDQLVVTLAQGIFSEPRELALSHKIAILLRHAAAENPDWQLPEMSHELDLIAKNERRFLGFAENDSGFNPDAYPGKVVVATIHKAKGLEWDRVYLLSVNNYDFPAGMANDRFIAEKWYLRDNLNLDAEALAQLRAILSEDEYSWYQEGEASAQARVEYIRERLRLFYVGLTRAREQLVITWNTGRDGKLTPAVALEALRSFWEEYPHRETPEPQEGDDAAAG